MKTIEETVEIMEGRITEELSQKINRVCLIQIGTNEDAEFWTVNFTVSKNRIYKGKPKEDTACQIIVKELEDWFSIINGETNPTAAFMSGKIKIEGDISTALKMQSILSS
jgi:putative sterol carrier protein